MSIESVKITPCLKKICKVFVFLWVRYVTTKRKMCGTKKLCVNDIWDNEKKNVRDKEKMRERYYGTTKRKMCGAKKRCEWGMGKRKEKCAGQRKDTSEVSDKGKIRVSYQIKRRSKKAIDEMFYSTEPAKLTQKELISWGRSISGSIDSSWIIQF